MAVADECVAIGQAIHTSDPSQRDAREVVLIDLPHDLTGAIHLENAVVVAAADEGVAIGQTNGAVGLIAPSLGTVAALALLAEEGDVVLPDDLALRIVFPDATIGLVGHQVIAIGDLTNAARVGVRIRVIDLQLHLALNLAVAIHFNDPGRAGLGDHRQAILNALKGMHLHRFAGVGLRRVVFPDHLLVAIDLLNLGPALLQEHIAIGQHVRIVDGGHRNFPLKGTIGSDDRQSPGGIIGGENAATGP